MAKRSKRKSAPAVAPAVSATAEDSARETLYFWLGVATIVLAVFWVYSPAIAGGWLWDDDWYITNQPMIHNLAGLWKTWFTLGSWVEYYPLEETLLWIEWHLFGNDTLGYHLVTLALHALNALLVWRVLAKLGLRKAWLGGLIFAVHPAAVDSVAWIAETKNTFSTLPCLLAMSAWIDYDDHRRPRDYALALSFFLMAMLGKIAVVPLPVVLLLYAWWKRRRVVWRDVIATVPFFVIAVAFAKISLIAGDIYVKHEPPTPDPMLILGAAQRIALAGQTLWVYFAHIVWPVGLLPNYPQWNIGEGSPLAYAPWLVLAGVLAVLWWRRDGWGGAALFGFGFFLLFLAPFLGFVVAAYTRFTWVMDHYLYLSMIGLIGLAAAAVGSIEERTPAARRIAITGVVTLVVTLLAFESHGYANAFSDEATLWGYTVEHNPGDWLAHDNLGKAQLLLNQPEDAEAHFRASLLLRPGRAQAHLNLGRALVAMNRLNDGLAEYDTALAISPTDPEIYNQKGVAFLQANRAADALAPLQRAVELRPHYAIGLENLGAALALTGRLDEAVETFRASLDADPDDVATHVNLGRALHQLKRNAEANDQFRQALQLDPDNAAAKAALGQPSER